MKNIKSLYFSKIIFPYIVERKKLKLIKYNRILQKNIYISIIDSKFYTRKYIIYETNKYVNEYDNNNSLSFDGEDLNGERNYVRTLNFEGEYLNWIKWNGRGYAQMNNIAYELKNYKGITKEYNDDSELKFKGEYLNREGNRRGKEY